MDEIFVILDSQIGALGVPEGLMGYLRQQTNALYLEAPGTAAQYPRRA